MIKEMKALSMVEANKLVKANEGSEEIQAYFKKYMLVKEKEVIELRKDIENLKNHKIREEHIAKIIDFLPIDASDMNKIFTDVGLNEDEVKQIKDIVAKYK